MPNASLINSLSFSMTSIAESLDSDTLFSAMSTGGTVSMMINFGENTNIGYFLVIEGPPDYYNNPNGQSWYITFGNSADPKKIQSSTQQEHTSGLKKFRLIVLANT